MLSGSQRYEMMTGVTESLAGRINLIDLYGLSLREIQSDDFREEFMPAARTGQLLNIADVAKDTGISVPTAEKWLSVLVASNVVYVLKPYHNNVLQRLIKTPKAYFLDIGLVCYLIGWDNAQVLRNGAMSGAIFETFVIGEIVKSWANYNGVTPNMNFYYFRDKDGNEIDMLIKRNGIIYPIEIKKHINCDKSDIASFKQLDKIPDMRRGEGCVICMADDVFPITATDKAVGVRYL